MSPKKNKTPRTWRSRLKTAALLGLGVGAAAYTYHHPGTVRRHMNDLKVRSGDAYNAFTGNPTRREADLTRKLDKIDAEKRYEAYEAETLPGLARGAHRWYNDRKADLYHSVGYGVTSLADAAYNRYTGKEGQFTRALMHCKAGDTNCLETGQRTYGGRSRRRR